jgi:hypothetical protein
MTKDSIDIRKSSHRGLPQGPRPTKKSGASGAQPLFLQGENQAAANGAADLLKGPGPMLFPFIFEAGGKKSLAAR